MTALDVRFPAGPDSRRLHQFTTADARRSGADLTFGDERVIDFLAGLARALSAPQLMRAHPEIAPLAFFLRRESLRRLLATQPIDPHRRLVPRGLALHISPANIPVLFMYSWALSALAGNANVVRLSSRVGAAADAVLDAANQVAEDRDDVIRRTQFVVSYDRDDEVTAALSRAADIRVIWGGDDSVAALRAFPTGPATHDVIFPDRFSATVVSASSWLEASPSDRAAAADALHSDLTWYDQAACSSPLTLFWIGDPATTDRAARSLAEALDELAGREPPMSPAMQIERRVRIYGLAIEGRLAKARFDRMPVMLELSPTTGVLDRWSGAAVLAAVRLDRLEDLPPRLGRRVQTLTHFGLGPDGPQRLAGLVGPRGVDRVVPIGQALMFDPVWDGYDLLRELSRVITVR